MEWTEVKAKVIKKKPKKQEDDEGYMGGYQGNTLYSGPIKQAYTSGYNKSAASKGASAIADFDPNAYDDSDEEIKFEKVTLTGAKAVQNARLTKKWPKAKLEKAINEKEESSSN